MATYVALLEFTDQGIRNVRETTKRAKGFEELAGKGGGRVREIFWTLGQYDLVCIFDAPDDESATALLLAAGGLGNVRSHTMRAFSAADMEGILARMPKT